MKIIKLVLFIFSLTLVSCKRDSDADNFLIGSKLNLRILEKCNAIYFTKNHLVLHIDFRAKGDFGPYYALFFYDKELFLTNKAFPIDFESIKGNKVSFYGNLNRMDISNFPKEFYFRKIIKSNYVGGEKIENKIITNSLLKSKSKSITFQISRTKADLFAVYDLDFPLSDSLLLKEFPIEDTLAFKLEELKLYSNSVAVSTEIRKGFYKSDILFYKSDVQKEQFYREILYCIKKWCK